MSSVQSLVSY